MSLKPFADFCWCSWYKQDSGHRPGPHDPTSIFSWGRVLGKRQHRSCNGHRVGIQQRWICNLPDTLGILSLLLTLLICTELITAPVPSEMRNSYMEGIYLSQCPAHSESSANVSCCCHYPHTAGGSSAQLLGGDIHKA